MTDPVPHASDTVQGVVVACLKAAGYAASGNDANYGTVLVDLDVSTGASSQERLNVRVSKRTNGDRRLIEIEVAMVGRGPMHQAFLDVSSPQASRNMIRNITIACVCGVQMLDPSHRRVVPQPIVVDLMGHLTSTLVDAGFGTTTWPSIDGQAADVCVYESNSDQEFARIEAFAVGGTTLRIVHGDRIHRIHTDASSASAHRRVVDAAIPILEGMLPPLIVQTTTEI